MSQVKFKRKTTSQINNLPVEDGSFIVDYEAQKAYVDVGENRIPFAGATPINNQRKNSTTEGYSCSYINEELDSIDTKINTFNYCLVGITNGQTASTNYEVQLNAIESTDNNMFSLNNGKIVIGSNVNTIRISGSIFIESLGSYSYVWGRIYVKDSNNQTKHEITCISNGFDNATAHTSAVFSQRIIPVEAGDTITVVADCPQGGLVRPNYNQTWLQIEKIN